MGNTEQTQKKLLLRFSASLTHLNMKSSAPVRRYKDPQLKSHVVCLCRVFHLWKNKRSNKILFALGFYSVQCEVCHHDCLQVRVTGALQNILHIQIYLVHVLVSADSYTSDAAGCNAAY